MSIAAEILDKAKQNGVMIATAESCTGGMVAAALTKIPGSSAAVDRGFVTYSNSAKQQMLGVDPSLIAEHGAVSQPVAHAMAAGAIAHSDAVIAVSITGLAGPGGSDHKPEGRVCFAAIGHGQSIIETIEFGAIGRAQVRQNATTHAIALLAQLSQNAQ